jgi:hypothetical protein
LRNEPARKVGAVRISRATVKSGGIDGLIAALDRKANTLTATTARSF